METEQAQEEQVTPKATQSTTFDLLTNESRLEDQGEVEAIEPEPAEIGENRAIEVKRRRGRPKLVRTGEKGRPRIQEEDEEHRDE